MDPCLPDVSVLLGTYNRRPLLEAAVASIRASVGPRSYEIVVTDGGSTDGSRAWLSEQADVVLVGERGPLGGAVRAFNRAWAVSSGRFIATFNDDAEYSAGALEAAVAFLEEAPKDVWQLAFPFDLRGYMRLDTLCGRLFANYGLVRRSAAEAIADVQGAPGHFWNPIYRTYGADYEFSAWVWKLGGRVVPFPAAKVFDRHADDALRASNAGGGDVYEPDGCWRHPDSNLFWTRWEHGEAAASPLEPLALPEGAQVA